MDPFLAQIVMFGSNFAPRAWAFCDGQLMAISQNSALFSLLGTIYGGDGRTTFGLPDLRGRVPMHPGNGPGLTPRQLGQKSGVEYVTLNASEIPQHNHAPTLQVSSESGEESAIANQFLASHQGAFNEEGDGVVLGGLTSQNVGGSQAHTNVQPYTCVNFIIALQGVYPSRN